MKFILFYFSLFFSISLYGNEISVVVPLDFKANSLKKIDIQRIFLAKTNHINGHKIKTMELKNSEYKDIFYKKITNKTQSQLRSYWTTLIFTGKANPPKQFNLLKHLFEEMSKNTAIITYIPSNMVNDNMKILYTLEY